MMKNERPLSKLAYLFRFALDLFTCIPFLFLTLSRLGVSVKLEVTEPKQKRTQPLSFLNMSFNNPNFNNWSFNSRSFNNQNLTSWSFDSWSFDNKSLGR